MKSIVLLVYFIIGCALTIALIRHESGKNIGAPSMVAAGSPILIIAWPVFLFMVLMYIIGTGEVELPP